MPDPRTSPNLIIRLATEDDLNDLTRLHCNTFQPEDHIPVMLGKEYVRATYRWFVTSSQAYCFVADYASRIIGLVTVCDSSFTRPLFFACLPEFIRSLLGSPHLIFRKRLWNRLLRHPGTSMTASDLAARPAFAQMSVIAVDQEWRGVGIFRSLVEATKSYSKSRGSVAIRAGVYKNNQPSRRAFVKNGWIEMPELETNDTIFYVYFLDPDLPGQFGIDWPEAPKSHMPALPGKPGI